MTRGSEYQKRYKEKHPEKVRVWQAKNFRKRCKAARLALIVRYGGRCVCECGCTENNAIFLTIDHIHGRQDEIKQHGKRLTPYQVIQRLKRKPEIDPDFRILCYNCNCGHRAQEQLTGSTSTFGRWPSEQVQPGEVFSRKTMRAKEWRAEVKKELIQRYGARCECCLTNQPEFLTFDHTANDGSHEFKQKNSRGRYTFKFLLSLRKESGCKPGIRLLCYNCNCGRQYNSGVCPHESIGLIVIQNNDAAIENPF